MAEVKVPDGYVATADTAACVTVRQYEHIEQFFSYGHLPSLLQEVSKPFQELANLIMKLPRNPERTVALRKLLESKDAAVRAALAKEPV